MLPVTPTPRTGSPSQLVEHFAPDPRQYSVTETQVRTRWAVDEVEGVTEVGG